MKKFFRLNIGLVIARALYKSREDHLANIELLRHGKNGVVLTKQEKIVVVRAMLKRAGYDTARVWLPPAVLWGLEKIWKKHKNKSLKNNEQ